jgi:hypothetical protein
MLNFEQPCSHCWVTLAPSVFGENSSYLSFDTSGVLTASSVATDTPASLFASYTENGVTKQAFKDVTILNVSPTLNALSIGGPSAMDENSTAQFSANAFYDDYSVQSATPTWSLDSAAATISTDGQVTARDVSADTLVHVTGTYTVGGQTRTATSDLLIRNRTTPVTHKITATAGAHGALTPAGSVTVTDDSSLTFTASPDAGYEPDSWLVNESLVQAGGSSYVFSRINVAASVTVTFKPAPTTFVLIVSAGRGTVTRSPDAGSYTDGTAVMLTAMPPTNAVFLGWSGAATSSANPVTIILHSNAVVTANFAPRASSVASDILPGRKGSSHCQRTGRSPCKRQRTSPTGLTQQPVNSPPRALPRLK